MKIWTPPVASCVRSIGLNNLTCTLRNLKHVHLSCEVFSFLNKYVMFYAWEIWRNTCMPISKVIVKICATKNVTELAWKFLVIFFHFRFFENLNTTSQVSSCIRWADVLRKLTLILQNCKCSMWHINNPKNREICAWIIESILYVFVPCCYYICTFYTVPCYSTLLTGLQDAWSSQYILPYVVEILHQVPLLWPLSEKWLDHNILEVHINVQIYSNQSLIYIIESRN